MSRNRPVLPTSDWWVQHRIDVGVGEKLAADRRHVRNNHLYGKIWHGSQIDYRLRFAGFR
jgi:hypothetical protein